MHRHENKKYYLMLLIVVITWGLDPIVNRYLFGYYSAAALSTLCALASALMFLFIARKKWKRFDRRYLCIAMPISLANSLACILQRIGLQYTTPARYAFLEHLSCITVPLFLFLCFRKRPSPFQALSSLLCLGGCLILTGAGREAFSLQIGDILCGAAGLLLGLGIVLTAICTKDLDITLFMTVHMCAYFLTSTLMMLSLHLIPVNGAPIEPIVFTLSPLPLLFAILFGLFSVGICWLLRNEATRHIHPTAVAVISPFAALVTALVSILFDFDTPSPSYFIAGLLILASAILAGLTDGVPEESTSPPN